MLHMPSDATREIEQGVRRLHRSWAVEAVKGKQAGGLGSCVPGDAVVRPSEQADDSEVFFLLTQKGAEMAKRVTAGKVQSLVLKRLPFGGLRNT